MSSYNNTKDSGFTFISVNILKGILYGFITMLIFLLIFALVLSLSSLSDSTVPGFAIAAFIFGSIICGAATSVPIKNRGWLYGAISGLIFSVITLLFGRLIFDGNTFIQLYLQIILGTVFGLIGGILGVMNS